MDKSDDLDLLAAVSMIPAPDGLIVLAFLSEGHRPLDRNEGSWSLRPYALAGAVVLAAGLLSLIPAMA